VTFAKKLREDEGKPGGGWSAEELTTLRAMTMAGESARAISEALPGRTREAVIGKWHRSEWYAPARTSKPVKARVHKTKAPEPEPPPELEPKVRVRKPKPIKFQPPSEEQRALQEIVVKALSSRLNEPPTAEEVERSKTLLDLSAFECRWVIMSSIDKVPALFCASPLAKDHPRYCEAHVKIAFRSEKR